MSSRQVFMLILTAIICFAAVVLTLVAFGWSTADNNGKKEGKMWEQCIQRHSPSECRMAIKDR